MPTTAVTFIPISSSTLICLFSWSSWPFLAVQARGSGPVIGSCIVVVINEVLTAYANIGAEFSRIAYGLLLVLVIMYLPNGLIGLFGKKGQDEQKGNEHSRIKEHIHRIRRKS